MGHWEGDTLVIDTVNFNARPRPDSIGHPQKRPVACDAALDAQGSGPPGARDHVDDPKTYTKPWKNTRIFTLRPDWEIMEFSCEENNKSLWEGRIKPPKN